MIDSSFVTADGARDLQQSVVIDAPVAVLWKAFVDPKEFERWNSPVAAIDLRVGGTLEASYDPARKIGDPDNIKHRIVTFLPNQLLVFQNVQAPHELPHADLFQRTVTVVQYEALGPSRTRVTLSCTGWATDPTSRQLYGFFQKDNAEILEKMKVVYEAKP
ncbi:MAG: SRPBCC domain-containing protein [Caulobacteraceae bacterium]